MKEKRKSKPGAAVEGSDHPLVQEALKEMKNLEVILEEELSKHFSLQLDVRQFENLPVKLDSGEVHAMNRLGRVSVKSQQLVAINFSDNPTAIGAAKLALQSSSMAANPQQEGVTLFVSIPKMSRERRQELASNAKKKLLSDYKVALKDVYSRFDKKSNSIKVIDEKLTVLSSILSMKRTFEANGAARIEAKKEELLREVI